MKTKEFVASLIEAARAYTQRGFYVVPIPTGTNHPTIQGWQKLRLRVKDVKTAFSNAGGIGLLLKPSKLTDVDLDCPEAVAASKVLLPPTGMVQGRRGNPSSHHYYTVDPAPQNKSYADPRPRPSGERTVLIELRANGQTVAPPSHHLRAGEAIRWEAQGEPEAVDGDDLHRAVAMVASAALVARYWPHGSRHYAAMAISGMLLRAGWTEKATKKFIMAVATAAHDDEAPSRLQDVVSTIRRLQEDKQVTGTPTLADLIGNDIVEKVCEWLELKRDADESSPHHTDLGNARRLVAGYGKNLRFCHESGKWLVWNGEIWATDDSGMVDRIAKDTVRKIYIEAGDAANGTDRQELGKHGLKSEAEARLRAMVNLAKTEPDIPVNISQLDADPWLLNCRNGTLDLRTGKLLPHHPGNLCTKTIPVAFDPDAKCPTWISFLRRVMAEKRDLIKFLQRSIGYALTGSTGEQVLFFLYGTGANGKSTFIETCRNLLEDYAQQSEFDTFVTKKNDGPRNDIARLKGARLVAAVEAAQGRQLAENVIKQVTGGDTVTARFLYHEHFEYLPQFKLFLVANHKPVIVGTDEAIWRRIRLIPFTVTIPREQRDKQLLEKLRAELPGILAWAVRGCLQWQADGLGEPDAVSIATADYKREMDVMADFIEEHCVLGEEETINAGLLYLTFQAWAEKNGEEVLTQKRFGTQLRERGFAATKKKGQRCWVGLGLKE
jgi:putative DNA primase/helicase